MLFATGALLIGIRQSISAFFGLGQKSNQDVNVPLDELVAAVSVEGVSNGRQHQKPSALRRQTTPRVLLAGAVVILVLRIELLRRILNANECTISSVEVG